MNASTNTSVLVVESESLDDTAISTISLHPLTHTVILTFACLGVVGNSVAAVVWGSLVKTRSGAFYLTCLGVTDALFGFAVIVLKVFEWINMTDCQQLMVAHLLIICALFSRHVTLAVVVQRCVVVSRPLTAAHLCSMRRQVIALICLLIPVVGVAGYGFYVMSLAHVFCPDTGTKVENIDDLLGEFFILFNIYELLIITCEGVVLVCLLLVSTILLYSTCSIQPMQTGSMNVTWHRNLEQRVTTIYLCLTVFSLVEISFTLFYILHNYGNYNSPDRVIDIVTYISQLTTVLISDVNFVIYSCIGIDFRERLMSVCTLKTS